MFPALKYGGPCRSNLCSRRSSSLGARLAPSGRACQEETRDEKAELSVQHPTSTVQDVASVGLALCRRAALLRRQKKSRWQSFLGVWVAMSLIGSEAFGLTNFFFSQAQQALGKSQGGCMKG